MRRPTLADPLRRTLNDRVLLFFENSTASCAVPGADGSRQPRASHELDLAVEDIDHTPCRVRHFAFMLERPHLAISLKSPGFYRINDGKR
jgi:hypothetical protein